MSPPLPLRYVRKIALALGLAWLGFNARAASAPEWLRPLLAEDISAWQENYSVINLLDFDKVDYLAPDRTRELLRGAVRVTSESGKEHLFASLEYNPNTDHLRSARAWVISPNGKKVEAFRQADFADMIATYSTHFWDALRTISFHSSEKLEIGGVVAWEFEVDHQSSIFDSSHCFLSNRPTLSGVFEATPCAGTKLEWFGTSARISSPSPGSGPDSLRWEVQRLDPLPEELPANFYPNPLRICVRCAPTEKNAQYFRTWAELARLMGDVIEPQIQVTPEVKAQAEKLTAGRTSRWERIRSLTEFIQNEITYLCITQDKDSLAGCRPHTAAEVLRNRYGDCKDKAAFLTTLLRSIGENGYVVLVYSGDPCEVPPDWPSVCFNHAIAAIPADSDTPAGWPVVDGGELGRLVLFDPTHPFIPLGVLPHSDQSGFGLIANGKGRLVQLSSEDPNYNGVKRTIQASLDDKGGLVANVDEKYFGLEGAEWHVYREEVNHEKFSSNLHKQLLALFPQAQSFKSNHNWDPQTATFAVNYSFKLDKFARAIGQGRILITPRITNERTLLPPWKVKQEGVAWTTAASCHEEILFTLPDSFVVSELPDTWQTHDDLMTCHISYRKEGRTIIIIRDSQVKAGFNQKANYDSLKTLKVKIQDAISRPITLQPTTE